MAISNLHQLTDGLVVWYTVSTQIWTVAREWYQSYIPSMETNLAYFLRRGHLSGALWLSACVTCQSCLEKLRWCEEDLEPSHCRSPYSCREWILMHSVCTAQRNSIHLAAFMGETQQVLTIATTSTLGVLFIQAAIKPSLGPVQRWAT